jgi:hypothetical protein
MDLLIFSLNKFFPAGRCDLPHLPLLILKFSFFLLILLIILILLILLEISKLKVADVADHICQLGKIYLRKKSKDP